jgi:signal transduction histidine kinase
LVVASLAILGFATTLVWQMRRQARTSENLRASEAGLREAQQLAKLGNWELDLVSGKLSWSDEIYRIFEIDPAQFGASYDAFLNAIHPDDREPVNRAYTASVANRTGYAIVHRLRMPDGRIKHVEERGQTFYGQDGKPLRSVGTVQDVTALHEAEQALRALNAELEARVEARTAELKRTNSTLAESLEELRRAQARLVQSERMAALGGLVAGIAHEINTPVGIGVTAASHIEIAVRRLRERFAGGQLTRQEMEGFLDGASEASEMVLANLQRAADLIRSFKQVAVDQSSGERRAFRLKRYLEEVLVSLGPQLRTTRHEVRLACPEKLEIDSYPGAYSQIVTNLVMNSLTHGFEGIEQGRIDIEVGSDGKSLRLCYRDNGRGIAPEHLPRIFEPFFTTRRGQGGSGLGMHVVYNLVTQTLGGSIECRSSPGEGVSFEINVPIDRSRPAAV